MEIFGRITGFFSRSLRIKLILAITFSILVSMWISNFIDSQILSVISNMLSMGQISIYINTAVNLAIMVLIIMLSVNIWIIKPIRILIAETKRVAAKDLTIQKSNIKSHDEMGQLAQSFSVMFLNLKDVVEQLQKKSGDIASFTTNLSLAAENVSTGASETATTISDVASLVSQISKNTKRISGASVEAGSLARTGSEGLLNFVAQMEEIQQVALSSGLVVRGLGEAAGKITQIVELITQIADQTNLLALNAAIEAARAGENGRGFAVVAEEVRKLAEGSAGAAKEIKVLIANVQSESEKAVQGTELNANQVEAGTKVVQDMKGVFENIVGSVQDLAERIKQIASSAEDINSATQNVAAATQEQTATMEEVASTTHSLTGMATELETLAAGFRLA